MNELNGPATYRAIAQALPYGIQSTLLSIRSTEDEGTAEARDSLYRRMPIAIYCAIIELCLVEEDTNGLKLTTAGRHLADYCSC